MGLEDAINQTPELKGAYKKRLEALDKKYRKRIEMNQKNLCEGSADIDTHLVRKYPQDNRWDYVIGYKGKAYFVEFHSAKDSEVKVVLKKLQWLKNWLTAKAPRLKAFPPSFFWISEGRCRILPNSKYARQCQSKGIHLVGQNSLVLE